MQETAIISCPYCGERSAVLLDHSISHQQYIEDCQVCCHPIVFVVSFGADGQATVRAYHENE
jgi:hypothetical protein